MDERAIRISEAIEKSGLSYPELERLTGVSKSSLQRYATGVTKKIPIDCIEKIAEATHTDARYLMGWDDTSPAKPDPPNAVRLPQEIVRMVPLYESVAAGFGAYADSSAVGIIPCCIESDWEAENSIGIKVKGDSMYPKIEDGDIVVVCKDMDYDDGQIVVARIDEDDAVVKRIRISPTRLVLESINPEYQDRIFEREEMNRVHIEGVVRKIVKNV